ALFEGAMLVGFLEAADDYVFHCSISSMKSGLSAAQCKQRDFWFHAEPRWNANGSQPTIYVQLCVRYAAIHRQRIPASDKAGHKTRRTDAVIHNLHLQLPSVGMTGKAELDSQFGSAAKTVGIVREKDIRNITAHQQLQVHQHGEALALIIDADQVDLVSV